MKTTIILFIGCLFCGYGAIGDGVKTFRSCLNMVTHVGHR